MLNAATIAQQKHVTNKGEGVLTCYTLQERKKKMDKYQPLKRRACLDGLVPLNHAPMQFNMEIRGRECDMLHFTGKEKMGKNQPLKS